MTHRMRAVLVLLIVVVGCLIAFSPASHGNTVQSADLAQVSPSAERVTAHPPTPGVTESQGINDGIAQTTDLVRPMVVTSVVTAIPNKVVSTAGRTLIGEFLDQLLAPLRGGASTPEPTPTPMRPILVAARLPATPVVATPTIEVTADARQARVPILMYHYVSAVPDPSDSLRVGLSVTPEILDQHLKFFKAHGWHTVSLEDIFLNLSTGRRLPDKPIVLTFDDGYLDAYTNAFPLLKKYNLRATFFVFSGAIGFNQNYLTWSQIKEMSRSGMSIESHTYTHPDMRNRDDQFLQMQIQTPIEAIERETGKRPRFFAYPAGQYDANAVRMLQVNGTLAAVTTYPGMVHQLSNALTWDRVRVTGNMPISALIQVIGE